MGRGGTEPRPSTFQVYDREVTRVRERPFHAQATRWEPPRTAPEERELRPQLRPQRCAQDVYADWPGGGLRLSCRGRVLGLPLRIAVITTGAEGSIGHNFEQECRPRLRSRRFTPADDQELDRNRLESRGPTRWRAGPLRTYPRHGALLSVAADGCRSGPTGPHPDVHGRRDTRGKGSGRQAVKRGGRAVRGVSP